MATQDSTSSALTMVAQPGHPHLTLLRLIPLLQLILMMMNVKRLENKMKMTIEASRRPPHPHFGA
jgi:hypothetical protein